MSFTPDATDSLGTSTGPITFHYAQPATDRLTLEGKVGAAVLSVQLEKLDTSKSLLTSRGFHGINEEPYNR